MPAIDCTTQIGIDNAPPGLSCRPCADAFGNGGNDGAGRVYECCGPVGRTPPSLLQPTAIGARSICNISETQISVERIVRTLCECGRCFVGFFCDHNACAGHERSRKSTRRGARSFTPHKALFMASQQGGPVAATFGAHSERTQNKVTHVNQRLPEYASPPVLAGRAIGRHQACRERLHVGAWRRGCRDGKARWRQLLPMARSCICADALARGVQRHSTRRSPPAIVACSARPL